MEPSSTYPYYVRASLVALLVYLSGKYGVSFLFVLLVILLMVWNRPEDRLRSKNGIRTHETYPDFERAEFLNRSIQKFWPFCADHLRKTIFVDVAEKMVQCTAPAVLSDFKFVMLDLGDVAPQLGGIKVYDTGSSKYDELIVDFEMCYFGDARIRFSSNKLLAGIKHIQVVGDCRAVLKPLINRVPFAGAVSFSFLRQPAIDFEMTDIANVFDIPGLKSILKGVIYNILESLLVYPNKFLIPLATEIETTSLFKPELKGVLLVCIVSGTDIARADFSMLNKRGKSDPYVNVYLGKSRIYKTRAVDNSTNPHWNEILHVIVEENEDSEGKLVFEVRDKDPGEDDFLGSCELSLRAAICADEINLFLG
ncbi:hypothetical protein ACOME3_006432 [Neoechinorhynchus agilis]